MLIHLALRLCRLCVLVRLCLLLLLLLLLLPLVLLLLLLLLLSLINPWLCRVVLVVLSHILLLPASADCTVRNPKRAPGWKRCREQLHVQTRRFRQLLIELSCQIGAKEATVDGGLRRGHPARSGLQNTLQWWRSLESHAPHASLLHRCCDFSLQLLLIL